MKTNENFLNNIAIRQIIDLYELLSGVFFWIKDKNGEIIYCNNNFVKHVKKSRMEQVIGLSDYDLSPSHIAKQFVVDDNKVLNGEEVTNRLELNLMNDGNMGWFITSKRPLRDETDSIVGTYGISKYLEESNKEPPGMELLQGAVDYIRENYANNINVQELADLCHLSVSALERRFKKYLSKTPLQFLNEVRLEHARRLLIETELPIARIGNDCGFTEHSYFSKQFSRFFEELPSEIRKKYRSATNKTA